MVNILIALFLPWLLGVSWLQRGWYKAGPGSGAAILGYGYFLGMALVTLTMRMIDVISSGLDFKMIVLALCLLTGAGIGLANIVSRRTPSITNLQLHAQPKWQKWLFILFLILISLRLVSLGLEVIWRPLFPWDSWIGWGVRARVWFEQRQIVDFIAPHEWWRNLPNTAAYNAYGIDNPIAVSLIQTWMSLSLGHWNDSLINLPWLFCVVSLGLAFYGQSRLWGISPLMGMLFVYLLLSIPILNTHTALAGYGDLWMATSYALAALAFIQWARTKDIWQGVVSLIFVLILPLIKESGIVIAATFIPAAFILLLSSRQWLYLLILTFVLISVILISGSLDISIPGIGRILIDHRGIMLPYSIRSIGFQPITGNLITNLFIYSNWNVFWYLFCFSPFSIFILNHRSWLSIHVLISLGILIFFYLFCYTRVALSVTNLTVLNRIILSLVPTYMFYVLIIFDDLIKKYSAEDGDH